MHTDCYISFHNPNIRTLFPSFFVTCWVFKKISVRNKEQDAVLTQVVCDSSLTDNTSCYAAEAHSDR